MSDGMPNVTMQAPRGARTTSVPYTTYTTGTQGLFTAFILILYVKYAWIHNVFYEKKRPRG